METKFCLAVLSVPHIEPFLKLPLTTRMWGWHLHRFSLFSPIPAIHLLAAPVPFGLFKAMHRAERANPPQATGRTGTQLSVSELQFETDSL